MSRSLGLFLGLLVAVPGAASSRASDLGGADVWQPQAVRWPVAPDAVEPVAPWVPTTATDRIDAVEVTPSRAAALWVPAVTVRRVRVIRGEPAQLRLARVGGTKLAKIVADEVGIPVAGGVDLAEPVGPGSMWVIAAAVPTTIVVERIAERDPRLAWEQARDTLLGWIDRDCSDQVPELPVDDGGAAKIRLRGGRALASLGHSSSVQAAIRLWRLAQVETIIATLRPGSDPYVSHHTYVPDGPVTTDSDEEAYGPSGPPGRPWRLRLRGPGVLVVDTRATPEQAAVQGMAKVEIRRDGSVVSRVQDVTSPVALVEPGAALPWDGSQPAIGEAGLGRKIRTVVPLALGDHEYEVDVTGAGLVRADARRRTSRMRDWISSTLADDATHIRAGLAKEQNFSARALGEQLVSAALGSPSVVAQPGSTAAALLAQLVAAPGQLSPELAKVMIGKVTSLVAQSDGDLERAIIVELAERLPEGVDATPLAAAVLVARRSTSLGPRLEAMRAPAELGGALPSSALLAALAPHLYSGTRSDAVAAAELAWRRNPNAPGLRTAVLAAARRSALRRLDPTLPDGGIAAAPGRWLSVSDSRPLSNTGDSSQLANAISEVALGRDTSIQLAPHPEEPDRLGVVRVFVATPAKDPGPVTIAFDGEVHPLLALRSLEVVEIAATSGRHVVRIDAPSTTRAFIGFARLPEQREAPSGTPGGVAEAPMEARTSSAIRKRWPVDPTMVYEMPTPRAAGPVRIEMVGFPAERARRHTVWLHPDVGPPRRFVLDVRGLDPQSWPLDDDRRPGTPAAISVWLPPGTAKFWLTTDDGPLYAHVSVHGPAETAGEHAGAFTPPLPRSVDFETIAELSTSIVENPERAQFYIARAVALLHLGEIGPARRDLAAASPLVGDQDRAAYRAALVQLDALADPAYLPAQPDGGPIRSGVLIGTPLVPPTAELVGLARRARLEGVAKMWRAIDGGEIPLPAGAESHAFAATIAGRAGQSRAAAERWLRLGTWQARTAALGQLAVLLEAGTAAVAPLGVGIAGELEDVATLAMQHARASAARASRWDPVRFTERNAGFESLTTVPDGLDDSPAIALRRALLAAPWRAAPAILDPGRATVLAIRGPRSIGVEIWCRRLWPAARPTSCALTATVDQASATALTVQHAQVHTSVVDIPDGLHEVEIGLAAEDPTAVAAVRFVDTQSVQSEAEIAAVRPMRVFLAAPDRPAEATVAGPGAVGIELRTYNASATNADIAIIGPQGERHISIAVEAPAASELRPQPGRDVQISRPVVRTVALDRAGPYTIRVVPNRDLVAVRFATRVAARAGADYPVVNSVDVSDGLPWPMAIPQPPLVASVELSPRWTPSIEAVIGQDSFAALDTEFAALDLRVELATQVRRRERDKAWFGELRGRRSGLLGPTARIRVAGEFRRLPLGLNVGLDAHAAAQTSPAGLLWLTRAIGNVSRPLPFSPRLQLVPTISVYGAVFGPSTVPPGADPMVASVYRRSHPFQIAQSLELSGKPFADQYAVVGFSVRSNDSVASVDMIGGKLMWRGLIETAPRRGGILMLEYAPTLRFANNHRSYTFLRHDLAAEIGWPWSVARGRLGRIVVSLRGDLYPPTNISQSAHALTLSLRWDGWHPGERNRMPSEEPLSDFVDEVPWAGQR